MASGPRSSTSTNWALAALRAERSAVGEKRSNAELQIWVGRGNASVCPGPEVHLVQSESRTRLLRCGQAPSLTSSQQHRAPLTDNPFSFCCWAYLPEDTPCFSLGVEINGATKTRGCWRPLVVGGRSLIPAISHLREGLTPNLGALGST